MIRLTAIALCLVLLGCRGVDEKCRHRVLSQYAAAVEQYGPENAEIWRMQNADPKPYLYHAQVRVRPEGPGTSWFWLPNQPITEFLSKDPQKGCKPLTKIK
jgi:hypothetical protein